MDERLRIAFDVTPVLSGRTGIARYVNQLGVALQQDGVDLQKFAVGRQQLPAPDDAKRVAVPVRFLQRWWSFTQRPRIEQLVGPADLVHVTGLVVPPTALPLVVTVHDLAAIRFPQLHPARNRRQQRLLLKSLRKAEAIIAVSQATADDLAQGGISTERLVVAPLGLSAPVAAPQRPSEAAAAGSGPFESTLEPDQGPQAAKDFLLTVGETAPRKNYGTLLGALARTSGTELVMAGPPSDDEPRVRSLLAQLELGPRVTRLGAVSDSELAGLYRDALALCFPSTAEGFGLPVLEAMAVGLPVLASDIPVIRELAGDAALYVPPADERAWAEAIEALVANPALRANLAIRGRKRAAEFTWERTAKITIGAYRTAVDAASG